MFKRNKKGVELPITAIIIFVILIVVAVVLIVIFVRQTGKGSEAISGCALKQGSCSTESSGTCASGTVSVGKTADCNPGNNDQNTWTTHCCIKVA